MYPAACASACMQAWLVIKVIVLTTMDCLHLLWVTHLPGRQYPLKACTLFGLSTGTLQWHCNWTSESSCCTYHMYKLIRHQLVLHLQVLKHCQAGLSLSMSHEALSRSCQSLNTG